MSESEDYSLSPLAIGSVAGFTFFVTEFFFGLDEGRKMKRAFWLAGRKLVIAATASAVAATAYNWITRR